MDEIQGAGILATILVSCVGFVFFSYGKKMSRVPQLVSGIVLMAFPYFVSGASAILLVAVAIVVLLWLSLKWGW